MTSLHVSWLPQLLASVSRLIHAWEFHWVLDLDPRELKENIAVMFLIIVLIINSLLWFLLYLLALTIELFFIVIFGIIICAFYVHYYYHISLCVLIIVYCSLSLFLLLLLLLPQLRVPANVIVLWHGKSSINSND